MVHTPKPALILYYFSFSLFIQSSNHRSIEFLLNLYTIQQYYEWTGLSISPCRSAYPTRVKNHSEQHYRTNSAIGPGLLSSPYRTFSLCIFESRSLTNVFRIHCILESTAIDDFCGKPWPPRYLHFVYGKDHGYPFGWKRGTDMKGSYCGRYCAPCEGDWGTGWGRTV